MLLCTAAVAACSKEGPADLDRRNGGEVVIGINSPQGGGLDEKATYRVLLYEARRDYLYKFHNKSTTVSGAGWGFGTYYYNGDTFDGKPVLTPCTLSGDGQFVSGNADDKAIINGMSQDHYVAYISPGYKHEMSNGTVKVDPAKVFYATGPQKRRMGGYGVVLVHDSILVDRRARVGFRVYRAENIKNIGVREVRLVGAGGDGTDGNGAPVYYHPCTQQVVKNETERSIEMDVISDPQPDDNGNTLCYRSRDELSVIAAIYAPKQEVSNKIRTWYNDLNNGSGNFEESDYLYFRCMLTAGDAEETEIVLPLTVRNSVLRPMHTYVFNITVRSEYITLSMKIYTHGESTSWEEVEAGDGTIGNPGTEVDLGEFKIIGNGNDWETGNDDPDQEIAGTPDPERSDKV